MEIQPQVVTLLVANRVLFLTREFIVDLFSRKASYPQVEIDNPTLTKLRYNNIEPLVTDIGTTKVVELVIDEKPVGLGFVWVEGETKKVGWLQDLNKEPLAPTDTFTLLPEHIANFPKGVESIPTTIGQYITNELLFAKPYGDKIPYILDYKDIGKSEDKIAKMMQKGVITPAQYVESMNHAYWLCSFASLFVPAATPKSLRTHPDIDKVKAELLEKHKDELDNPIIASMIEQTLNQLDAEWIKGDLSEGFYKPLGSKLTNIARRKMFTTVGLVQDLAKGTGNWAFIPNSLREGWDKNALPEVFNELRKGSYDRGIETAKGGMLAKLMMRIFQTVEVHDADCGAKQGVKFTLTAENAKVFIDRRHFKSNGKWVLLTNDNLAKLLGPAEMRSPLHCQSSPHFCYTCMGETFRETGVQNIGMFTVEIPSKFTMVSMKTMHGIEINVADISTMFEDMLIE